MDATTTAATIYAGVRRVFLQSSNISPEHGIATRANANALFDCALEYKPESQAYCDKSNETSPAAMQKLMARQDNADRAKQAQLLLVGKISGMTDWRRRCRQDIDSADGKRDGVAKMHAWNRIFRAYGQSVWHNDNDQRQHLHDKPTEGKVRAISPCHACGREHKVGDQTHYRQGTEEPVVYSRPILENEHQCQHGQRSAKTGCSPPALFHHQEKTEGPAKYKKLRTPA